MKPQILLPTLVLVLSMLACNFPVATPVVTETPTLDLLPSPTLSLPTFAPTQTSLPTNTPLPPPTSTPTVPSVTPKDVNVNCRIGPGTAWLAISALVVGQSSQITGKSSDGGWWQIVDPLSAGRNCWVSASVVNAGGNLSGIPVVQVPTAAVTNVTVNVDPKISSVPGCMGSILPLKITGTIETNGPTQVQYRFETQQGGAMPNQTAVFETFGEKEFSVDYTPPIAAGSYSVKLVVLSPNTMQAESSYRIDCP